MCSARWGSETPWRLSAELSGFFDRRRLPHLRTSRIVRRRESIVLPEHVAPNTSALRPAGPEPPAIRQGRGLKARCHARDVMSMGRAFSPPPERARGWAWSSWAAGPGWYQTGTSALGATGGTRRCLWRPDSPRPANLASPVSARGSRPWNVLQSTHILIAYLSS